MYQVLHSTLGRYRIRIPQLASSPELVGLLKSLVESLAFVTEVRINIAASSLIVSYEVEMISSATALEKVLDCIQQANSVETSSAESQFEGKDLPAEVNQWQDLAVPCLSLSLALLAAPLELPAAIAALAIAGAAMPWLNRATDSLVNQRQPNIDLLDWAWMALHTLQGQYVAPALKTVLVEGRRSLRGTAADTKKQQSLNLLNELEQSMQVERNGQEQLLAPEAVNVGDCVIVNAGELIPVDGQVLHGAGLIDRQNLTGETIPAHCWKGQEVYASTVLLEGRLWIQVKRIGVNTRAGLAAYLTQLAPIHDTQIGALQAELVKNAVLPTLIGGGAVYLLTGNLSAAIAPYQLDFGSAIPISLLTVFLQALTYAASQGIYIRSGRVLEILAQIDTVVVDQATVALNPGKLAEVLAALDQQKIATYLITTTPASVTFDMAQQIGIHPDQIYAEAKSIQKVNLVRGLCHQGRTVAVVGATDDAMLLHGNVSIAFAQSSEILNHTADIVLLEGDLNNLVHAIGIAKRAMEMIYQNTALIVVPNVLMQIGGAMLLGVNPVYNVIVNNTSAFIAEFLNSSRPLFETNKLPSSTTTQPTAPNACSIRLQDSHQEWNSNSRLLKQKVKFS